MVVDPRPAAFTKQATQWLQVLPGTDQALRLAHLLIEAGTFNREFLRQWTNAPLLVRADSGRLLRQGDLEAGGSDTVFYGLGDGDRLVPYDAARGVWPEGSAGAALVGALHLKTLAGEVACHTAFALYATVAAEWPPDRVARVTGVAETVTFVRN